MTSDFRPKSSFSRVEFVLGVHSDGRRQLALHFNTLFKVEAKPEFDEALKFIRNSRKHLWPSFHPDPNFRFNPDPNFKQSEKNLMLDVSSEILVPLCKEVTLEKTMRPMMAGIKMAGIKFSKIRLGTLDTWHGTPDMRVRGGVHLVHQKVEEGEDTLAITAVDSDYESVSSDGMTTTIEDSTLPQVVATCVVSSFTESSLHPDKPALVPTILIDEERFRVCLYDCKKDVLLISNAKSLSTKGGLSQSGMALLWVVLNYR